MNAQNSCIRIVDCNVFSENDPHSFVKAWIFQAFLLLLLISSTHNCEDYLHWNGNLGKKDISEDLNSTENRFNEEKTKALHIQHACYYLHFPVKIIVKNQVMS